MAKLARDRRPRNGERLNIGDWQRQDDAGDSISPRLRRRLYDDPTIQLTKFVSHDLSPINNSGSTDRFLDALFVGQAVTTDPRQRAKIVREFERHALTEAYAVPLCGGTASSSPRRR